MMRHLLYLPLAVLLQLLLLASQHVECRHTLHANAGSAAQHQTQSNNSCSCPHAAAPSHSNLLAAAPTAAQNHVLMKVRMLPTAAGTLLSKVKAGGSNNSSSAPEAWVRALVASTAAATAQQLHVPASMLSVSLEASLGSGLNVPLGRDSDSRQAAVDALAEFYEQTTGSRALLVGLNLVNSHPSSKRASSSSGGSTAAAAPAVLALATINGPLGDLAHALRMTDNMQGRCPELFQLGRVLPLTPQGSEQRRASNSSCAGWLSDRYLPAVTHAAAPATPAAANTAYQATVLQPLEVNIKLSIKLSLPDEPSTAHADELIERARQWLQSPDLDSMLQQHGLRVGAGSPAHLVTLMASPAGAGGGVRVTVGIDEQLEADSSPDGAAAAGDAAAKSHDSSRGAADAHLHKPQAEVGHHGSSPTTGRIDVSATSAWGRVYPLPHELKPLVVAGAADAHADSAAVPGVPAPATAEHDGTEAGSQQHVAAGGDDEIARRTVLGAIVGAVVGSAVVGAGCAMLVVTLVRQLRRGRQPGSCEDAAGGCSGGNPGRSSTGAGRRRKSRKRYLKYLPNMHSQAPHLLPVAAPPASPRATADGSSAATALPASSGCTTHTAAAVDTAPTADGGDGLSVAGRGQQQEQQRCPPHDARLPLAAAQLSTQQEAAAGGEGGGVGAPSAAAAPAATRSSATGPSSGSGRSAAAAEADSTGLQAAGSSPLPQLPPPSAARGGQQQQQQTQHAQQQAHHSRLGARLLHGLEGWLRPAASDPLQLHSRRAAASSAALGLHGGSSGRMQQQHAGSFSGLWSNIITGAAATAGADTAAAAAVTRQELCSDSVSSAARLDLLHSLQRSASAGSSSTAGGNGSSRAGTAYNPAGSSRPVSPTDSEGGSSSAVQQQQQPPGSTSISSHADAGGVHTSPPPAAGQTPRPSPFLTSYDFSTIDASS